MLQSYDHAQNISGRHSYRGISGTRARRLMRVSLAGPGRMYAMRGCRLAAYPNPVRPFLRSLNGVGVASSSRNS